MMAFDREVQEPLSFVLSLPIPAIPQAQVQMVELQELSDNCELSGLGRSFPKGLEFRV